VRQGLALLSHELSRHSSRPNASFTYHMAALAAYMKHRAWCARLCLDWLTPEALIICSSRARVVVMTAGSSWRAAGARCVQSLKRAERCCVSIAKPVNLI
jgi:hypothetical protein